MTSFAVTGAHLHEAAAWASRIVPTKPAMPMLGGLLLAADGDQLTLSGFDLDTCGTTTIPATVKEPGRLLLSAKLLTAVAKTIARDVEVTVEQVGGVVEVRCGRSEWAVPVMDVDLYPQLPANTDAVATVDAATLRRALARVLPAVSTQDQPPALTGVLIEPSPSGGAMIVATDRYRLAVAEIPLTSGTAPDVLVPAGLLDAAVRAAGDGDIAVSCAANTFGLASARHSVVGRQMADQFPRWRGFVPDLADHHARVDVAELGQAIAQAQVMSPDVESAITLRFDGDGVRVSAQDAERRAHAEAAAELHGDPAEVLVKPSYLLAALGSMESTACEIHFFRTLAILVPVDTDGVRDSSYRHLVMYRAVSP